MVQKPVTLVFPDFYRPVFASNSSSSETALLLVFSFFDSRKSKEVLSFGSSEGVSIIRTRKASTALKYESKMSSVVSFP